MRFLRTLAAAVLTAAAGGLALWSLFALGGAVSETLDILTHFAPLALFASAMTLALARLILRRGPFRRNVSVAAFAAVVWSGALMAPELYAGATQRRVDAAPATLKLVQFNVWAENADPAATADWVRSTGADLVLMQETDGPHAEAVLARLRTAYPYGVACTEVRCSLALLSRWPIEGGGVQRQRWRGPNARALSAAWAEVRHPAGAFHVVTTHYTWPTWVWAQEWQRASLVRLARRFPQDDLILTGDFNLTPWSKALHEQDARLGLERRTRSLFSWPAAAGRPPVLPIDHVYAGNAWRTVSVERGPRLGSDHYPVVVTLSRSASPVRAAGSPAPAPRSAPGTSAPDRSPAR